MFRIRLVDHQFHLHASGVDDVGQFLALPALLAGLVLGPPSPHAPVVHTDGKDTGDRSWGGGFFYLLKHLFPAVSCTGKMRLTDAAPAHNGLQLSRSPTPIGSG